MTTLEGRPAVEQSTAPAALPVVVGRGWYGDPAGCHQFRYWDGTRWTPGVADNGFVREDPLPEHPCVAPVDERVRPPLRALAIALAGLALGVVLCVGVALGFRAWSPGHKAVGLALSQAGLWIGMLGAAVVVSRRYGSGSLRQDFGLRIRPADAGCGFLLGLVARILAQVFTIMVLLAANRLQDKGLGPDPLDNGRLVVQCFLLVIGAPVVEELFFRGLILRSLQTRLITPLAVGLQAVLFSACHALTASGIGLVAELLSTLLFGLLAGAVVVRFRRLGPTIVAHALFNTVAAAILIAVST